MARSESIIEENGNNMQSYGVSAVSSTAPANSKSLLWQSSGHRKRGGEQTKAMAWHVLAKIRNGDIWHLSVEGSNGDGINGVT